MTSSVGALQDALAGEHAAIFVGAALGGRTSWAKSPALVTALQDAYDAHVAAREQLAAHIVAAGAEPVGPAASYDLPAGIDGPVRIERAALHLERECAARYLAAVPQATSDARRLLVGLLCATAARELSFGGSPTAFPGTQA